VVRAEDVAVVLLAAGRSARFGDDDKRAADLGGQPLIAWAAQAGRAIPAIARFLIDSGDEKNRLALDGYRTLTNAAPDQGLSSSLRIAAQAAVQAGAGALLILLADMPFVTGDHLRALLDARVRAPDRAVFTAREDGRAQPPALFPRTLFPALMALSGDRGAKGLAGDATRVAAPPRLLLDIDTPADLDRARQLLAR
jgi:molybdenum cofactor cytidylyltransferase